MRRIAIKTWRGYMLVEGRPLWDEDGEALLMIEFIPSHGSYIRRQTIDLVAGAVCEHLWDVEQEDKGELCETR